MPDWPADRVERRTVASLLPYARNARTHSEAQVAQIAASIQEWGWTVPVLVDEGGQIIAGHGRVMAAKSLGLTDVPAMVARGWSDAAKRAYALADNKLALNGDWDVDLLKSELLDLRQDGFALDLTGFGGDEIGGLLNGFEPTLPSPATDAPEGTQPQETGVGASVAATDADDAADAEVVPPRQPVARVGDLWRLGEHRLLCGDSTDAVSVDRLLAGDRAALLFTSPPYGNQRAYTTGGISDWDRLMQGVFQHLPSILADDGQALVNLGLIHRDGEWQPYWQGWVEWMRGQGWRRFGLYCWDQGPGLPGDWNGRLAPAFELVFHFNRVARQANKIVPCKWAGTANYGSGLRAADGEVKGYTHTGMPVQDMRIPDSVLRISRHKARGIEVEHPAVFPVALPEFILRAYTDEDQIAFEPFSGSGSTIVAGQRTGRRVRAIELAPSYVDLTIARFRMLFPDVPVTLDGGATYDEVATERENQRDAA